MKRLGKAFEERIYNTESPMEGIILREILMYGGLEFKTQHQVDFYRLDFAFPKFKIGLEVDGVAFHNSEAQKSRDDLRDAYLTEVKGWVIERVPGWFVYRNPSACVAKAVRHIDGIEKYKRFHHGKANALRWFASELANDGNRKDATLVIEKLLSKYS